MTNGIWLRSNTVSTLPLGKCQFSTSISDGDIVKICTKKNCCNFVKQKSVQFIKFRQNKVDKNTYEKSISVGKTINIAREARFFFVLICFV